MESDELWKGNCVYAMFSSEDIDKVFLQTDFLWLQYWCALYRHYLSQVDLASIHSDAGKERPWNDEWTSLGPSINPLHA